MMLLVEPRRRGDRAAVSEDDARRDAAGRRAAVDRVGALAAEDDRVAGADRDVVARALAGGERRDLRDRAVGGPVDRALVAEDDVRARAEVDRVGAGAAQDDARA